MGSGSSRPASTMAELMAKHSQLVQPFKKGQDVVGIITSLKPDIMMRVADKTDVIVLEKDRRLHKQLLGLIAVGEKITATVLYPESDSGYSVVTIRKYMEDKVWEELDRLQKEAEKILVTVTDVTRGGLVVEAVNGVSGFLPNSHLAPGVKPEELLGQKISASIVELSRENRKVVFSQKGIISTEDVSRIATEYKAGTKVSGKISGITSFGIFVSLPFTKANGEQITVDGLVHISEIAWETVSDLTNIFSFGQTVDAVVIGMDPRSKRIDLSIKRLTADPFQKIVDAFPVDKKVRGAVSEITENGIVLDLGQVEGISIAGFIKKDKIPANKTYEKGQSIEATVVSVDSRKRKIMLTPVLLEKPLMYR